jgi:hypothetical protein
MKNSYVFSEFDDLCSTAGVGISVPILIMDSFGDNDPCVFDKRDSLAGVDDGNAGRTDTSPCDPPSTGCPIFVKSCLRT